MPAKFTKWREGQQDAIEFSLNSPARFNAICAPCGSGKSLTVIASAVAAGGRACILTSSRALQSQIVREFGGIGGVGLRDIRGRSNYSCSLWPGATCEEGAVSGCKDRGGPDCPHGAAVYAATNARIVISNYAAWAAAHRYGRGWGDFDLLVLDECASAPDHLDASLRVHLRSKEVRDLLGLKLPIRGQTKSIPIWVNWALKSLPTTLALVKEPPAKDESMAVQQRYYRTLRLHDDIVAISKMAPANWLVDDEDHDGYLFDAIQPAQYAESHLYFGVPHVLLVSATVRPKTLDLLGIPERDRQFREYPSTFDPARCPVYHIETVRLNQAYEAEYGLGEWLTRLDQIMGRNQDRKGLIHTVSFKRAQAVMESSRFRDRMRSNRRGDLTAELVERFTLLAPPAVLVSPSISTGFDFAGKAAEYQIIGKVPFLVPTKIQKARSELDKSYTGYQVMQTLVQAIGRIMRDPTDQGVTYIPDDSIVWFMRQFGVFAPRWVHDRYSSHGTIPPPPAAL